MSWTYSEEHYKNYTRDTWNESAPSYAALRANLDLWNPDLLRHASVSRGESVVDVACGDGEPSISLARAGAHVTGIDLAERMVEIARRNAKAQAVDATFETMDAEKLTFADGSFDLATCRFGLQIVTDPDAAISEIRRTLKPRGRIAATVWGAGERCAGLDVIVAPMLEHAEPDETGYLPTPYEMGGEGELADILRKAGFEGMREERITHMWRFPSPQAWLDALLRGTPLGHSLSEEEPQVQEAILAKTAVNMQRYVHRDGTVIAPTEALVVSARKA